MQNITDIKPLIAASDTAYFSKINEICKAIKYLGGFLQDKEPSISDKANKGISEAQLLAEITAIRLEEQQIGGFERVLYGEQIYALKQLHTKYFGESK